MLLTEQAPAKINLGLHVLRRRPDGYHDVETVLHRIDWADTVTAQPAEALSMTCSDPALPTDGSNLCMQAAEALANAFEVSAGAALHLEKRVPYGAGLGGGSSDAAATLRLLTRLWALEPPPGALHDVARRIGADVPFFLEEVPAAYATGRGDDLTPLWDGGTPYRLPYPVLVVVPPVEVATPEAYARVTPDDTERPHLPSLLRTNNLSRWCTALRNDFEAPMTERHSEIREAMRWLHGEGAKYVSLSGSGGAVFGLFGSTDEAETARARGADRPEQMHLTLPGADPARTGERS